jgi:putative inorganic carbon (HCO3(-)) transporter
MLSKVLLVVLGISFGAIALLVTTLPLKWIILVFIALAGCFGLVLIRDKKRFILTLMVIDTGLLIDVNMFHSADITLSRDGLQISVTTMTLAVLYLLWWAEIVAKKAKKIDFFPKTTIIAFGYILSYLLSMYNSSNTFFSVFDVLFLIQMLMVYFYIANYMTTKEDIIYIVNILLVCLFIQSSLIFIQSITRTQLNFTGEVSSAYMFEYFHEGRMMDAFRPTGTGGSPNVAGGHIAMLLLMMLSVLFYAKNRFMKILVSLVLLMGIAALILTLSRGSWMGLAAGLLVFLFVALRRHWISGKKVLATAVLIAAIIGVFSGPIVARLSQDDQGAAWSRVPLMKIAFKMIQEHPFIGVGVNNFSTVLPEYLSSELRGEWLYIVHNHYLLVLAETGIIGALCFLLIMAIVIHTCLRCIKHNDPFLSPLSAGILSSIIGLLLIMAGDLFSSRLTVQLFWIMISIVVASERLISIDKQQILGLSTRLQLESLTYERSFMAHRSG